jgi:mono/diheme cytochrome c family protein
VYAGRCFSLFLFVGSVLLLTTPVSSAREPAGVLVGWDRFDGSILLEELNCVACHAPGDSGGKVSARESPLLAGVGGRVTPQYLRAFLSNPQHVKPGTPMPDLLHALPEKQREETVDQLVHYLVSLGGPIDQRSSGASLMQIKQGEELYHTIGCVACHQPFGPAPAHKKDPLAAFREDDPRTILSHSIPLGDLASKTTVEALARFLEDPLAVRPSGRMPHLPLEPGESRHLAAYLLREQYSPKEQAPGVGIDFTLYEGGFSRVPDFEKLTPKLEGEARNFDLATVEKKWGKPLRSNFAVRFQGLIDIQQAGNYRFWTRSDDGSTLKIDGKVVVNNDGVHAPEERQGEIQLQPGKHPIEVGFQQVGGGYELSVSWQPPGARGRSPIPSGVLLHAAAAMIPRGIVDFKVEEGKAQHGKELFSQLGCASCHATEPGKKQLPSAIKAPPLLRLDPASKGGCLAEEVQAGRPRFALVEKQRQALREALTAWKGKTAPPTVSFPPRTSASEARLEHTMSALRCYACHTRNGKGGPDQERFAYFVYTAPVDLGDEGRRPPPLDDVGAKLSKAGFEETFFSGKRYRTYMATRMPLFGKDNVGHLPEWFADADRGKVATHEPAPFSSRLVDDGRLLLGSKTLVCLNCHSWGGLHLPGAEGVDLVQSARRLQPDWFHALLVDPQKVRPGTRMPAAWPEGKSYLPDIQGGDMHKQIDALWTYLSLGLKGGMPPGLSPDDRSLLVPTTEPIVFRTFLDQVGAHAILVGFRERTHLAFDANRVRSVEAWTGDFVSTKAAWEGRAGLYAQIAGSNLVRFPEGPPFATLDDPKSPWPDDVPKANLGSRRTPPGWRYLGYQFDKDRVPTFLYRIHDIDVEETPGSAFRKDAAVLFRKFRLTAPRQPDHFYLRVAEGKTIIAEKGMFVVDDHLRYRITAAQSKPIIRAGGKGKELLVPIRFAPVEGGKRQQAELLVELNW